MIEFTSEIVDRVQNSRIDNIRYCNALNTAIEECINKRYDASKIAREFSFERSQKLIDELVTLVVKSAPIAPVNNYIARPANYKHLILNRVTIDGTQHWARPITHSILAGNENNPFKSPKVPKRIFYTQDNTGIELHYGTGSFTSAVITYLKLPDIVTVGFPRDEINAGPSVLTAGLSYSVIEDSVHNGQTYYPGESFVAANTVLTSGQVVLTSVLVNSNMPVELHKEICEVAASKILNDIQSFDSSRAAENQAEKQ